MGLSARDLDLIAYLRSAGPLSSQELSTHFKVSRRTIRDRIHHANASLGGAASIEFGGSGYELIVEDEAELQRLCLRRDAELPSTPQERVTYLIDDLLQRDDWIPIDRLAEILYVSRACITRDLKEVERILNSYDLELQRKPHRGIKVVGSEINKRICLAGIAQKDAKYGIRSLLDHDLVERIAGSVNARAEEAGLQIASISYRNSNSLGNG